LFVVVLDSTSRKTRAISVSRSVSFRATNYKNEADALVLTTKKLAAAVHFIGEEREKWQKEFGPISLESTLGSMVRDHDILITEMVQTITLVGVTPWDLLYERGKEA
jgi:hypothetical protein